MRLKRIFIVMIALIVLTSGVALANSNKVKVLLNGNNIGEIGEMVDGAVYLPMRKLAESMQAVAHWDVSGKKAHLYKPNVHILIYNGDTFFGMVEKGFNEKIRIIAQADNVKFNITSVRFSIVDPSNKETVIDTIKVDEPKDVYWFSSNEERYRFSAKGDYIIKCYFMTDLSNDWVLVGEKYIPST